MTSINGRGSLNLAPCRSLSDSNAPLRCRCTPAPAVPAMPATASACAARVLGSLGLRSKPLLAALPGLGSDMEPGVPNMGAMGLVASAGGVFGPRAAVPELGFGS